MKAVRMNNDKALYRKILNQLSKEANKPFFFLKQELAVSEVGFMMTDATLLVGQSILSFLEQRDGGYSFRLENSRFLPITASKDPDDGKAIPFAKLAPVVIYVFDKYINNHNLDLHNFYSEACRLLDPSFQIYNHAPWRTEIDLDRYIHLDPARVADAELKALRPAL